MANPYYTPSGSPANNSAGSSSTMRAEFSSIEAAFDKFPALTTTALIKVNGGATALIAGATTSRSATSWTPAFTFATPGNLSVNYLSRSGTYCAFDNFVLAQFAIYMDTFTHTTASGNAKITGLPVTSVGGTNDVAMGGVYIQGIATVYAQIMTYVEGGTEVLFGKILNNSAAGFLDTTNFPTGSFKNLVGSVLYRIA